MDEEPVTSALLKTVINDDIPGALMGTATDVDIRVEYETEETPTELFKGKLELILIDDELAISVTLETPSDEYITDEDETTAGLCEDNTGVLSSGAILELAVIFMDRELDISALLETVSDNDATLEDKTVTELSKDTEVVL